MQLAFHVLRITAWMLAALGLVCLLLGGYLASRTLAFTQDARETIGTVTGYREIRDGEDTRFRPRVRFVTPTREIIEFDAQLSAGAQRFAIGTRVPVVYRANAPLEARINLFTDNWLGASVAAAVALASLAAAWLLGRSARREIARAT